MTLKVEGTPIPTTGTRLVAVIGVTFWFITSLPLLALFAAEAAWARWTGKEQDDDDE